MTGGIRDGKVALITGAAGGLGEGLVNAFAAQGWKVVACPHRARARGDQAGVRQIPMDVTLRAEVEAVVEEIDRSEGRIDVLVNNAGVAEDGPFWSISEEGWERVLAVNLKGAMLCSQAVARSMARRGTGHIVNISSFAARQGTRGQSSYATAKAGLLGLTQSLAREWGAGAEAEIRVNAVLPGVLPTPMTRRLSTAALSEASAANVLGRLNSVGEVASFVVFLASMQNVSGQIFQLDSRISPWT